MLIAGGVVSYAKLLPREGFPPIQFPLTLVNVTSIGTDAKQLDENISKPVGEELKNNPDIDTVQTSARDNFATVAAFFNEEIDPAQGTQAVKQAFDGVELPKGAQVNYTTVNPSQYLNKYSALVSVYASDGQSISELEAKAAEVAKEVENLPEVKLAGVERLTADVVNPATGEPSSQQIYFNQVGINKGDDIEFFQAVTVGVVKTNDTDVLELSEALQQALDKQSQGLKDDGYGVMIGADFAESLTTQIDSLQENLLTGIAAVVAITFLLISARASIITAIFMVSVILVTMLTFVLVGYTLNTITLFALVLTLGLFVDDATIMVEAIDAERQKRKNRKQIIKTAASKVALASFAGTMTTILVFAPLAFISGILGEFIRVMPVTVVISLLISYFASLFLVPILARFTLLRNLSHKQLWLNLGGVERYASDALATSIRWLKTRPRLGIAWGTAMIGLSLAMLMAGGVIFSKVDFNIFPPSKDSEQLQVNIEFAPDTSISDAEALASDLNKVVADTAGDDIVKVVYGGFTQPDTRSADMVIKLSPIDQRGITSPEIASNLKEPLEEAAGQKALVRVVQIDAGPPSEQFPFKVQIYEEDAAKAVSLAKEVQDYLTDLEVFKPNGEKVRVTETKLDYTTGVTRIDGRRVVQVEAGFDDDEVSAIVGATQQSVEDEFTTGRLVSEGYNEDTLEFDFGQESENAESFQELGIVFPIALALMFVLLAVQFKSLLQPLLIFLAIPFSVFGIASALAITDNPLSFFSMIGVIGLVGIAVNNTIMLTDYANQEFKRKGSLTEALAVASKERFRPLVTTSLTTVVALLPLALYDPFWQPLAVVIIGGLLSSTFLVILAFPYYYLVITKLGRKIRALLRRLIPVRR